MFSMRAMTMLVIRKTTAFAIWFVSDLFDFMTNFLIGVGNGSGRFTKSCSLWLSGIVRNDKLPTSLFNTISPLVSMISTAIWIFSIRNCKLKSLIQILVFRVISAVNKVIEATSVKPSHMVNGSSSCPVGEKRSIRCSIGLLTCIASWVNTGKQLKLILMQSKSVQNGQMLGWDWLKPMELLRTGRL